MKLKALKKNKIQFKIQEMVFPKLFPSLKRKKPNSLTSTLQTDQSGVELLPCYRIGNGVLILGIKKN